MGGRGSNRWRKYKRKLCVENFGFIKISDFLPLNLEAKSGRFNLIVPSGSIDENYILSFFFRSKGYKTPNLRIDAYSTWAKKIIFSQCLQIVRTELPGKGERFWFKCLGVKYEKPCQRRMKNLYLDLEENSFKCRHCLKLTYKSTQEYKALLRKLVRKAEKLGFHALDQTNQKFF